MLTPMLLFLLSPVETVPLEGNFARLECFEGRLYLAPSIGQSIFRLESPDSLTPLSFTDDVNYRIRDFRISPFSIYINRGSSLEKFYPASGRREYVYNSLDIAAFDLTRADEVVLADRQRRRLIFLDREHRVRMTVENVLVEDMRWAGDLLHVLTRNWVLTYDEYGNQIEKKLVPERCDRIIILDFRFLIFPANAKYVFIWDSTWTTKKFPHAVSDICVNDSTILILDGIESALHIIDRRDF